MNLFARIAELANWLEWALDTIDLYDKRLAEIDGPELVYTETHVRAKELARGILKDYGGWLGVSRVINTLPPASPDR